MAAICGSLSGLYLLTQDWLSTSNDTVSNLDPTLESTTLEVDPTQIHLPDSIVDSSNSSTIDSSNSSTIDNSNSSEYRSILSKSDSLPFLSVISSPESSDDNLTIEPSREMIERTTQTEVPYIRVRFAAIEKKRLKLI